MNNVLTALCGTVNFMPPWIMLGVFGAIILLIALILILKGAKRLFFRLIIYGLVAAMVLSYLAYLCYQIATWDSLIEIIAFAIGWGPTILFTIGIIIAVLRGVRRGLRKSLILALHAACAGAVCVAFFFLMVYVKEVDAGALKFFNWLAGDGALQRLLGVSESCSTLKEVLAAYIVTIPGVGFGALSPYVYTLVDMAYRIIFGILSCLMFFAIDFVLYIVYVLCYSQRKYKKNRMLEFQNGKTDKNYKKHRIGGGIVGFVRGAATGLLCLSFLGSAFFVVAGGKGEGKLDEHDFGNEELNFYYQIYRSVESYGAQGIFKILNAMSDANDTPYYLFAADLVFSGELNDEEFGISENVKFREEIAAFTGFARDTFDLLIKYGPDEIDSIVNGESESAFDTIVDIMTTTGFKEEFDSLIDAFDAQTYIINLSMAFVNTVVSNIDDIEFTKDAVGEGEKELIKLIFKKGFLTDNIPDERELIRTTGLTEAEGEDIRPYLTVNHILNKNDVKLVLNIVLSLLAGEETGDTLQVVKRVVPEMGKLSILGTRRKDEVNPILGRMYCLFENLYLTADGEDGVTYSEITEDGIDWIGEMHQLFDAVDDTVVLYDNVGEADLGEEAGATDILKYIFNEESAQYKENMEAYDNICELLTESRVLGRALTTNFVYKTIYEALTGLSENIYLPQDIVYKNTVDKNGNKVYGETYQLLYGVKLLFSGDNSNILDNLMNASGDKISDILNDLANAVKKPDANGNTLVTYMTESQILRSVISIQLIEVEGNTFYVPKAALEKLEGEYVNLITKKELTGLLENMDMLVEYVTLFEGSSTKWQDKIDDYLIYNDEFYYLVETNRIFEGTVARLFNEKLGSNSAIIIPNSLNTTLNPENIDGWITVSRGRQGELLNLLDALRKTKFSIRGIILGGENSKFNSDSVLKKVSSMDEGELEDFFSSKVLHYTVSKYVLDEGAKVGGGFSLVVPKSCRQALQGDIIVYLVKKNELIDLFKGVRALELYADEEENPDDTENTENSDGEVVANTEDNTDEGEGNGEGNGDVETPGEGNGEGEDPDEPVEDPDKNKGKQKTIDKILVKIASEKWIYEDSRIISASIVSTLVNNEKLAKDTLSIPELYDKEENHMGSKEMLEYYDSTNRWTTELPALIEALDELLGLKGAGEDFSLEGVDVSSKVSGILLQLNGDADIDKDNPDITVPRTKLGVLYSSEIFKNKITKEVDRVFKDEVDAEVLNYAKFGDYYTEGELQKLCSAATELKVGSFEDFKKFDFKSINEDFVNEKAEDSEDTKLHVIYSSYIAKGLITKNVQKTIAEKLDKYGNRVLYDHKLAYESYLPVYRESEIESMIAVFKSLDGGEVKVKDVGNYGEYVYDTVTKETKSYIIVTSASNKLLNGDAFIVPESVYDNDNGFIKPAELRLFSDSMKALLSDDRNKGLQEQEEFTDANTHIAIPAESEREKIFESIIMRARITYELVHKTPNGTLAVQVDRAVVVKDKREQHNSGTVAVINEDQLSKLADAIEKYNTHIGNNDGTADFSIPTFGDTEIRNISQSNPALIVDMFESDIIRYRICELPLLSGIVTMDKEDTTLNLRDCKAGGTISYAEAGDIISALSH